MTATAKLSSCLDLHSLRGIKSLHGGLAVNAEVKFGNQVTLYSLADRVSIKLFKNGSVHLTGVKSEGMLFSKVRQVVDFFRMALEVDVQVSDIKIVMINSDFDAGLSIHRERFCDYMRAFNSGILFSYEPCIYQGVVVKYMCNDAPQSARGVCQCGAEKCSGKGRGHGCGHCRKVSIILFHSGKIIITGAVTMPQVYEAHRFIVGELDAWRKAQSH